MRLILLLLATTSATLAIAQSRPQPLDMLDVELAQTFAHKSNLPDRSQSTGLGFFTFDAPNPSDSKAPFSSYQVAILEGKAIVYYVRATKPFLSLEECRRSADELKSMTKRIPRTSVETEDFSRFQSRRGDEQVVVSCSGQSGSPYVYLEFMRRSLSIYEQLKAKVR